MLWPDWRGDRWRVDWPLPVVGNGMSLRGVGGGGSGLVTILSITLHHLLLLQAAGRRGSPVSCKAGLTGETEEFRSDITIPLAVTH